MHKIDSNLYKKYSKAQIEEAIKIMTYKKVDPLPKTHHKDAPILYVFRHGQSQDNANFLYSGWRDVGLTLKGRQQALDLANKIKSIQLDLLFSSDLKRAIETMKIAVSKNKLAKNLKINIEPRIKEKSYGDLQGKNKLEDFLQNPKSSLKIRRSFDTKANNGESVMEVCQRVAQFCDEILPLMKRYKLNVAVSCHGNSMRGFRRYFENLSDEDTATIETPLGQDYASYYVG